MTATAAVAAQAPPCPDAAITLDHLSWSGIQMYKQCSRKFYFHYIEKAPKEFVPSALAFGGAFHLAIEVIQEARIEGAAIPPLDRLISRYEAGWKENVAGAPEVMFGKTDDEGTLRELATRMLAAYREFVVQNAPASDPARIIAIEHQDRFNLLADVPPFEARMDLVEVSGPDLIVTDFKTSKSRWNETTIREHVPQLTLYSHAVLNMVRELGVKRIVPRFVVITKAKKPVVQVIEPKLCQDDATRLKQQVAEVWTAIQKKMFLPHEGWQCSQCPFRRRCLGS